MRHISRRIGALLVAVSTCWAAGPAAQSQASSLFAFTTNDFWLNLHHYLYVLGRAHRRMPDATQLAVAGALTRIYQLSWPERPYPTHVVAYANWQGAFSFTGRLMVLSSNNNPFNDRWYPLESVFHEAMHQWDDRVSQALQAQATRQGVT